MLKVRRDLSPFVHRHDSSVLTSFDPIDCSKYYTCQIELYDRLLSQSRPSVRPIEYDGQKVNVRLGFSLIRLVSVVGSFTHETDGLVTLPCLYLERREVRDHHSCTYESSRTHVQTIGSFPHASLSLKTWNATVLAWNSTAFHNVQHVRVPAHSIWTPKVELANP